MTGKGPLLKYIHRGRTVAWWWIQKIVLIAANPTIGSQPGNPNAGPKSGKARRITIMFEWLNRFSRIIVTGLSVREPGSAPG